MNITITSQGYHASIESLGAQLRSFCDPAGAQYIWSADPLYWPRSSPLLFPSIGNVREGKTVIKGQTYSMPRHGFAKDCEFNVTEQQENRVVFSLTDSPETYAVYPFHFHLSLTYELRGSSLLLTYSVTNRDTDPMYYHLGAHPGFCCPMEEDAQLADYILEFEKKERLESYIYDLDQHCFSEKKKWLHKQDGQTLPLHPGMFDRDALFFFHPKSRAVSLKHFKTGMGIRVAYPDFASVAFWTPPGGKAPFLCIEPWNGAAIFDDEDDVFSHKRDIQRLEQDETKTYHLILSILEQDKNNRNGDFR